MSKHTPGPWHVAEEMDDDDNVLYTVEADNLPVADIYRKAEHEANARLIAAAPELLEALKELIAWDLESLPGEVSLGYSGIEQDIAHAKAAIAKALGE